MSAAAENPRRGRARYYTPRPIHLVDGVVQLDSWKKGPFDGFIGTMEALSASGLAEASMFPGQPGASIAKATYNPVGVERRLVPDYRGEMKPVSLWRIPGRMEIARRLDGRFIIKLTVSYEEQDAREQAQEAAEREDKRRCEQAATTAAPSEAPSCAPQSERAKAGRTFLGYSINAIGLQGVVELVDAMRESASGTKALADMGMLHRRKLPAGWRVIEGQRPA